MDRYPGIDIRVRAIENRFFGEKITVAGLVTGVDLAEQLGGEALGDGCCCRRRCCGTSGTNFWTT